MRVVCLDKEISFWYVFFEFNFFIVVIEWSIILLFLFFNNWIRYFNVWIFFKYLRVKVRDFFIEIFFKLGLLLVINLIKIFVVWGFNFGFFNFFNVMIILFIICV